MLTQQLTLNVDSSSWKQKNITAIFVSECFGAFKHLKLKAFSLFFFFYKELVEKVHLSAKFKTLYNMIKSCKISSLLYLTIESS